MKKGKRWSNKKGLTKHLCPICGYTERYFVYSCWCSVCGWWDIPRVIIKCPNPCEHCTICSDTEPLEVAVKLARKKWKERKK